MKRILSIVAVLVLLAGTSFGQADTESVRAALFADCDFVKYGGMATATLDTFWCVDLTGTTYNVTAGIGLADYFPPMSVVVGADAAGVLKRQNRPVKRMVLYGVDAFGAQAWQNGASAPSGGVDGVAYQWPEVNAGGEHFLVIDYPDSVHTAGVAAADSVEVWLGY